MNFEEAKDEFLKWIVPVLLGGMFYELQILNNSMIEYKARLGFVEYRIDQHRGLLTDHTGKIGAQTADIARLQVLMEKIVDK